MIYRFYSQTCADILVLAPVAEQLLNLWGKDTHATQGILVVNDIPGAIATLQEAIAVEKAQLTQAASAAALQRTSAHPAGFNDDEGSAQPDISLRQRAAPVLDLLRRSLQAQKPVLWRT